MKKIYFLLAVMGITATSYAQGFREKEIRFNEGDRKQEQCFESSALRSAQAETKAWPDSTVYYNGAIEKTSKWTYEYEDQKRTRTLYNWEGVWVYNSKCIDEYDKNGNVISTIIYEWKNEVNDWIPSDKSVYIYDEKYSKDAKTNIHVYENYEWNADTGLWRRTQRGVIYNSVLYGGAISYGHADYVEVQYKHKDEYKYDNDGNLLSYEMFEQKDGTDGWKSVFEFNYKYDTNSNLIEANHSDLSIITFNYNVPNQITTERKKWNSDKQELENDSKSTYSYDTNGNYILSESDSWKDNSWRKREKGVYEYDSHGNRTLVEYYDWSETTDSWIISSKYVDKYGEQNQNYASQRYSWNNGKWGLISYSISYPNTLSSSSELEVKETENVGFGNEGSTEFGLVLPEDGLLTGRTTLELPNGITLNLDKTKLAPELADKLDLIITPLENNAWLIEIKFKELKSATAAGEYQKIMDVVYTVDPGLGKGSYEIRFKDIDFELNDGMRIIQESLSATITVDRYATAINPIFASGISTYTNGTSLIIDSPQPETIEIYSVSGTKLYLGNKPAGEAAISISHLPQGILIVKGSNGWVKKVTR